MKVALHLAGSIVFEVPANIAAIEDEIERNDAIDEWLQSDDGPIATTPADEWSAAVSIEETEYIG